MHITYKAIVLLINDFCLSISHFSHIFHRNDRMSVLFFSTAKQTLDFLMKSYFIVEKGPNNVLEFDDLFIIFMGKFVRPFFLFWLKETIWIIHKRFIKLQFLNCDFVQKRFWKIDAWIWWQRNRLNVCFAEISI